MKHRLVSSCLMSSLLCILMTLWVTYLNLGFSEHFITLWLKAFCYAWPVAWLISFTCSPLVLKLTHKICTSSDKPN
ncbi:DUF2798 domain-containing protein [Paraglaciecola sp. 2405UD69-4]|uniref:DUF2798 domain-containing protein n=1 Tax=Paraglaciecola sp. 2405UD69-4 TaxID=3391836 RepID=UPI0039C8ECE4